MTVGFIAIHYPQSDQYDQFVSRVRLAAELMRSAPGCLAADYFVTVAGDAVVSIGQWTSEEAQTSSFAAAAAAGADFKYDKRESRPREILHLVSP